MYCGFVKRFLDVVLALLALVCLSWLFLLVAVLIYVDDPGPVLFRQKRIGIHKSTFWCYKFRTMKMSTPHDTPTHLLENPEQYITGVGRYLRRFSIDELAQVWNILTGTMSWIGPRPALWNQEDLIAERDRYGANDVRPGLSGWAQINGRDELEIPVKARLDGEYTAMLSRGGLEAFGMDARCFFGTVLTVFRHEGVVEGGTGSMGKAGEMGKERELAKK